MSAPDTDPQTLLDVLQRTAARRPDGGVRVFRGGREVEHVTYAELLEQAGRIAAGLLQRLGDARGQRVALVFPNSGEPLQAFFGTLAAGAVPVPLPPPLRFSSRERYGERIRRALLCSRVGGLLTTGKLLPMLQALVASLGLRTRVLALADLSEGRASWAPAAADATALVQYTSGSTASPRGAVLTHRQVVANLRAIHRGLSMREEDVSASWLPLFHDMGLIGCFLGALYGAADQLLAPPEDFVRDPLTWLRVMSRYGATLATAPNWGYSHCAQRVNPEEARTLDLTRLRLALNGAEMVDVGTARAFAERFAAAGFRAEAMLPVYGLAEASLAVAFSRCGVGVRSVRVRRRALGEGAVEMAEPDEADAREVVSVGRPVEGLEIALLGADGEPLSEGGVGEILVRGASVMAGYDQAPTATRAAFHDGWLRTGDLGFRLGGELYVTGRRKDVIIVRGENLYAHDVEALAAAVPGVWARQVMAIGLPGDGTEELVVFAETRLRDPNWLGRVARSISEAVAGTLGIPPVDVVLLGPGKLPRTTSGKLERYKGPELYARWRGEQRAASRAG
jgi:acyl-CoA synthetase (AMP-forming)/AMP-acid ligase II